MQASSLRPVETLKSGRSARRSREAWRFRHARGARDGSDNPGARVARRRRLDAQERGETARDGNRRRCTRRYDGARRSSTSELRQQSRSASHSIHGCWNAFEVVPGVESVGIGNCPPVSGGCNSTIIGFEPGRHRVTPDAPGIGVHFVSPGYFRTLGIRLVRGRLFTDEDREGRQKVVVINDAAARRSGPMQIRSASPSRWGRVVFRTVLE